MSILHKNSLSLHRKYSTIKLNYPRKPRKNMTICIASICKVLPNSSGIVYCADRMISSSVNFEPGISKIKYIPHRALILEAGDATLSDIILDKWLGVEEVTDWNIAQIAEEINKQIKLLRAKRIEDNILSKFGLNYESYLEVSRDLNQSLLLDIMKRIDNFYLGVEFIVAGLDPDGTPQLYRVSDQEGVQCYNSLGFIAIGTGTEATLFDITRSAHKTDLSASEAIVRVYTAKKSAERVAGIGQKTDLGVLFLNEQVNSSWRAQAVQLGDELKGKLDKGLQEITKTEANIKESIRVEVDNIIYTKKEEKKGGETESTPSQE